LNTYIYFHICSSYLLTGNTKFSRGVEIPITYLKGSTAQIRKSLDPEEARKVEPGYLELKAIDATGGVHAICPGLR